MVGPEQFHSVWGQIPARGSRHFLNGSRHLNDPKPHAHKQVQQRQSLETASATLLKPCWIPKYAEHAFFCCFSTRKLLKMFNMINLGCFADTLACVDLVVMSEDVLDVLPRNPARSA